MFKKGDKVRFKTWEEMKAQYGLNGQGSINCAYGFTSIMDDLIDRERVYTINGIDDKRVLFAEPVDEFTYSTDMIKLVEERKREDSFNPWDSLTLEEKRILNSHDGVFVDVDFTNIPQEFIRYLLLNETRDVRIYSGVYENAIGDIVNYYRVQDDGIFGASILYYEEHKIEEIIKEWKAYDPSAVKFEGEKYLFVRIHNFIFSIVEEDTMQSVEWVSRLIDCMDETFNLKLTEGFKESFVKRDQDRVLRIIKADIAKYQAEKMEREFNLALKAVLTGIKEGKIMSIKSSIDNIRDKISDLEYRLESEYFRLKENQREIAYFESGYYASNNTELCDILKSDRDNIPDIFVREDELHFTIVQPLVFFDDDDWARCSKGYLGGMSHDVAALCRAIFERRCEITFETSVYFTFTNATYGKDRMRKKLTRGIPNPHIIHYNCWGDNKVYIKEALLKGEYDTAYVQMKSALAGITITDSVVMREFMAEDLKNDRYQDIPCIRDLETGEVFTIKEARKYYQAKEEGK